MNSTGHPIVLRPLSSDDGRLLVRATVGNVNWNGVRLTTAHVLDEPALARYTAIDASTFGVVAVRDAHASGGDGGADDAEIAGVVWAKRFANDHPGYGFVAADVPELALHVDEPERNRGLGARLLEALVAEAYRRGERGLSLSVETGNPARRLYERHGFVDVPAPAAPGTMFRAFD